MAPQQIFLQPLDRAVGIDQRFCAPFQKTLQMKEKILSLGSDCFMIRDETNVEVMSCKAKALSLHSKKEFYTTNGGHMFTLCHKPFSIPKQYYGESEDGRQLFHVQGKWHLGGAREIVTFTNTASTGEPIELNVAGDWVDRHSTIKMGEQLVAEIRRDFFNARQIFSDNDTYYVTIAPGMDMSLVAAICVALDEREQANKGN